MIATWYAQSRWSARWRLLSLVEVAVEVAGKWALVWEVLAKPRAQIEKLWVHQVRLGIWGKLRRFEHHTHEI
jgi:hypothetical protein